MTLDEAIVHAREVAAQLGCCECADEHRQLAEWLEELRERRKNDRATEHRQLAKWSKELCELRKNNKEVI